MEILLMAKNEVEAKAQDETSKTLYLLVSSLYAYSYLDTKKYLISYF